MHMCLLWHSQLREVVSTLHSQRECVSAQDHLYIKHLGRWQCHLRWLQGQLLHLRPDGPLSSSGRGCKPWQALQRERRPACPAAAEAP